MNQKYKSLIARLLLAFVLVSIGFALGKEVGLRSVDRRSESSPSYVPPDADAPAADLDRLIVYYFHATIRCVTCNAIERMTHETLETDFGEPLHDGRMEWRLENFHENEALADRYGVATSTVVLARFRGGREVDFRRLDRVWELVREPAAFAEYIRQEVRNMAGEGGG